MNAKRLTFLILKGLAVLIAVLITAEVLLRIIERVQMSPEAIAQRRYVQEINNRVYKAWLNTGERPDPFTPPFTVYANTGTDDPKRMKEVYESTILPPSQTWTPSDFLQDPARADLTRFTITTNTLGLRGTEYSVQKPAGVYRIVVLGAYDAFGHGVNDNESYAAILEKELRADGINVEVWNAGRHASTAIAGLARLRQEILGYDPDLLVLEYGSLDDDIFGDNTFPKSMRLPDSPAFIAFRKIVRPLVPIWGNSLLWYEIGREYFYKQAPERLDQFAQTMNQIISEAGSHEIPVVVVKQVATTPLTYQKVTHENATFFDIKQVFAEHPPEYPPIEEWESGYWASTWLAELDEPEWLLSAARKEVPISEDRFMYYPYYRSFLRLNTRGHEVIGKALAEHIKKEVLHLE